MLSWLVGTFSTPFKTVRTATTAPPPRVDGTTRTV